MWSLQSCLCLGSFWRRQCWNVFAGPNLIVNFPSPLCYWEPRFISHTPHHTKKKYNFLVPASFITALFEYLLPIRDFWFTITMKSLTDPEPRNQLNVFIFCGALRNKQVDDQPYRFWRARASHTFWRSSGQDYFLSGETYSNSVPEM